MLLSASRSLKRGTSKLAQWEISGAWVQSFHSIWVLCQSLRLLFLNLTTRFLRIEMVTWIRSSNIHTCKPQWSSAVCALHSQTQALAVLCPALIPKGRSTGKDSKTTIQKLWFFFNGYQARNYKSGMKSLTFWPARYREKKSNHFSCCRFFLRCIRRELGTLGVICWVYPFWQSEDVFPSFCSKSAEKRPCLQDLASFHDVILVSPNSALRYLSIYLEMLYWREWLLFQLYSYITGSRFWPLASFFRLFSVHSSICAISKEKKVIKLPW